MQATTKMVGKTYFNILFVILVVFDLVVTLLNWSSLRIVSKPLILLSLLLYFGNVGRKLEKRMYRFMLLALFFHGSATCCCFLRILQVPISF